MSNPSTTTSRPSYPHHQTSSSTTSSAYQSSHNSFSLTSPSSSNIPRSPQTLGRAAPLSSPMTSSHQYSTMHPSSHGTQPQSLHQSIMPDRAAAGRTAGETGALLSQYSLVAEAARRAQMAVLARDLDAMEM